MGEDYCIDCGLWRLIAAFWRCQACYDSWVHQTGPRYR